MKSNLLIASAVLAATAAIAVLPVGVIATGGNVLLVLGILAVFFRDYGRAFHPLRLGAGIGGFTSIIPPPTGLKATA